MLHLLCVFLLELRDVADRLKAELVEEELNFHRAHLKESIRQRNRLVFDRLVFFLRERVCFGLQSKFQVTSFTEGSGGEKDGVQ